MEITIVNPITAEVADRQLYMSILYLGTILHRNGYKVNIVDAQIENAEKRLRSLVHKSQYIGFSTMTSQVKHAIELSDFVKSIDPEIPIVWGGVHPTLFPRQTISDPSVDYVIYGEGELTLLELTRHFEGKKRLPDIRGLVYLENGDIRINPGRPYLDLNALSPPAWNLLKMDEYVKDFMIAGTNYGKSLPVHSGRGCPFRCTFCINTVLEMKKWRPLSAENMVNEIKTLKDKYGLDYIKFVDEIFFINRHRTEEFCRMMIREKLDVLWHATSRAEFFSDYLKDGLMRLAKNSGCSVVAMGIESGSQKILDMMKKGITPEQAIRAVKRCDKFGIRPMCSFMIGLPHETRDDIDKTLSLIREIKKTSPSAVVIGPQPYRPYPGSELYNEIRDSFKQPRSLRDWSSADLSWGYSSCPKYMPWVENPDYVSNLWFYVVRSGSSPDSLGMRMGMGLFKYIADLRIKRGMFGFPIDRKIFEFFQNIYYNARNKPKSG